LPSDLSTLFPELTHLAILCEFAPAGNNVPFFLFSNFVHLTLFSLEYTSLFTGPKYKLNRDEAGAVAGFVDRHTQLAAILLPSWDWAELRNTYPGFISAFQKALEHSSIQFISGVDTSLGSFIAEERYLSQVKELWLTCAAIDSNGQRAALKPESIALPAMPRLRLLRIHGRDVKINPFMLNNIPKVYPCLEWMQLDIRSVRVGI
jgi:hypothetical protein